MTIHRGLALLLAFTLLAASCGDDGSEPESTDAPPTDAAGDDPTTDDPPADDDQPEDTDPEPQDEPVTEPELTASWTGVSEDTIRVGAAFIDAGQLLEDFNVAVNVAAQGEIITALADDINANGGINGRSIELHVETFLPVGPSPSEEVCTKLTQDEEVFIVMGSMLGNNPLCFTELNDTPYVGFFGLTAEREARSTVPFIASEMSQDRQRAEAVALLVQEGAFDGKRVGLFYSEADTDTAETIIIPAFDDAGIDLVSEQRLLDTAGDEVATANSMQLILENFRADQVDVIVASGDVVPFARGVDATGWDGEIIMLTGSITNPDIFDGSGVSPNALEGAIGVSASKPTLEEILADELIAACVDVYNASGPDEPIDLENEELGIARSVGATCGTFTLLVRLLEAAGADLTPDTLAAAADGLGAFVLPHYGEASLADGKRSAANRLRTYAYSVEEQYFLPTGEPQVVG